MGHIKINGRKITNPLSRALVLTAVALILALITGVVLINIGIALVVTIIIAVVLLLAAPVVTGLIWLAKLIHKRGR